jgi:hypothetical protein
MPNASPLLVLRARAEARAQLVASGDYEFDEAIYGLMQWAIDTGLIDQLSEDAIVEIILDPFRRHDDKQA